MRIPTTLMAGRPRLLQRIKKSHGPDFEESFTPPKKERRRVSMEEDVEEPEEQEPDTGACGSEGTDPCCDFCLLPCHRDGSEEELLFCKDCPAKGESVSSWPQQQAARSLSVTE